MLHYTYDEYLAELSTMTKHIESELDVYREDPTYFDNATVKLICKLRDSLRTAVTTVENILDVD